MSKGPEQKLVKPVTDYLETLKPHIVFWKICDRHTSGIPDYVGLYKGKFFVIELKAPGKKPSDIQQFNIDRTIRNGGVGACCTSLHEVKHFISSAFSMLQ